MTNTQIELRIISTWAISESIFETEQNEYIYKKWNGHQNGVSKHLEMPTVNNPNVILEFL